MASRARPAGAPDPSYAVLFGDCIARHARAGARVRCQLASGHPPPHAAEVGPDRQLVIWEDNRDREPAPADG